MNTRNLMSRQFAMPRTRSFDYQLGGWANNTDSISNAAWLKGRANITRWVGEISGRSAFIKANSTFGLQSGIVVASVDNGPFTVCSYNSANGEFTLFSNRNEARHLVSISYGAAFSTSPYVLNTGDVFRVVGDDPLIRVPDAWIRIGDAGTITAMALTANTTNYTPANVPPFNGAVTGQNTPSIRFNVSSATEIWVTTSIGNFCTLSNGSQTFQQKLDESGIFRFYGLPSGSQNYNVWGDSEAHIAIGVFGSVGSIASARRLDQFGDSITSGINRSGANAMEVHRVGAHFGYVGGNFGISGNTIANLESRLDACLAAKTVTSSDVAILAIGRNNPVTLSAGDITLYNSLITKLLSKGYGKVLCRAVLPAGNGTPWDNTSISNIVTSYANPNVVFVPMSGLGTYSTESNDNVHPDANGYEIIANYCINTAYAGVL